jgi:hypothetical protein
VVAGFYSAARTKGKRKDRTITDGKISTLFVPVP